MTNSDGAPLTDATARAYGTAEAYAQARYGIAPEELRELVRELAAEEILRAFGAVAMRGRYAQ